MIFIIKMHWKLVYYKNALKIICIIKMYGKCFLLQKCIGNDFYYKNVLEIIFIIKIHWK